MIAYLDSSVMLANLFDERKEMVHLDVYGQIFSSRLLQTECFRVLIRRFIEKKLDEETYARMKAMLAKAISGINLIQIDESILKISETPLPVGLATLDSIHLSSAIRLKEQVKTDDVFFITYDEKLGKAAKVMGFGVLGI